jgi:osmoprotectant transport system substrate-binding protein
LARLVRLARALGVLLGFVIATGLVFSGVFALIDLRDGKKAERSITIGSKADTEGVLLAEIMATLIETRAGLGVVRKTALGGTNICFEALRAGEIDLYPEYTGTALVAILDRPVVNDAERAYQIVREELARKEELILLPPLSFNNTYALAMSEESAAALGVRRISELARHPELRLGFTAEFLGRKDGWPGLRERYLLSFRDEPRSMEAGLMYGAVAGGEVDVIGAYATDGRIDKFGLRVLEDDRHFFPPYQAAPLVRRAVLARLPALSSALSPLAGKLSDAEMRRLNAQVDVERRRRADVAREFVAGLAK